MAEEGFHMSDIVERAEVVLSDFGASTEDVHWLATNLLTELKAARRKVRYLELVISEEVGHLTDAERAELDTLYKEFA
jgi:hypothetical protein